MIRITWTKELADAARAVAADHSVVPHRDQNMRDVRSRAGEFHNMRVGEVLNAHQIEYTSCLRQRLLDTPAHRSFEQAWGCAYDQALQDIALGGIERGADVDEDATPDAVYDEMYTLAFDALHDAGVTINQARDVAARVAQRFAQP